MSLVYRLLSDEAKQSATQRSRKDAIGDTLRVLAVFSLPADSAVLGLRRERYELMRLARRLGIQSGRAVECEVLQYGVTRRRSAERARDPAGWDLLHLSAHGRAGTVWLEKADGSHDQVGSDTLVGLLRAARPRLKLGSGHSV